MKILFRNLLLVSAVTASLISFFSFILLLLGFRPFILTSQSMEPLYTKGSLVIVDTRTDPSGLKTGDVLVYRTASSTLAMHRLVGDHTLQGDSNLTTETVDLEKVFVGKEVFHIPWFGNIVTGILRKPLLPWGITLLLVILACIPVPHLLRSHTKELRHE